MSLHALQQNFRNFLLDVSDDVASAASSDGKAGLAVYHNAYRAQLIACLKDSYERLWAWLGDDAFEAAARRHVLDHPPTSWTLGDYGTGFDDTVRELYPDDPEIAEIAALDWALRRAFDGLDAHVFDHTALAEADWETAALHFVPTLTLLPVSTNCGAIWNAIAAGDEVPAASKLPEPAAIRVWRSGLQPHFTTIEEPERRALELAMSGISFATLCDRIAADCGVTGAVDTAGQLLTNWLRDGLLTDIR